MLEDRPKQGQGHSTETRNSRREILLSLRTLEIDWSFVMHNRWSRGCKFFGGYRLERLEICAFDSSFRSHQLAVGILRSDQLRSHEELQLPRDQQFCQSMHRISPPRLGAEFQLATARTCTCWFGPGNCSGNCFANFAKMVVQYGIAGFRSRSSRSRSGGKNPGKTGGSQIGGATLLQQCQSVREMM